MIKPIAQRTRGLLGTAAVGALTGLLATAAAIGVAQLVAGITGSAGEPVIAVGSAAIDLTPVPVKDFAIQHFGSHDKMVLLAGIYVVLALFAMLTGILARRRLAYGLAGLAVFAALGVAAEATRPVSGPADAVPTLAGVAAGAIVLRLLVRAAAAPPACPAETSTSLTDPIVVPSRPAGQTGGGPPPAPPRPFRAHSPRDACPCRIQRGAEAPPLCLTLYRLACQRVDLPTNCWTARPCSRLRWNRTNPAHPC